MHIDDIVMQTFFQITCSTILFKIFRNLSQRSHGFGWCNKFNKWEEVFDMKGAKKEKPRENLGDGNYISLYTI